jgi:hypothetical protein
MNRIGGAALVSMPNLLSPISRQQDNPRSMLLDYIACMRTAPILQLHTAHDPTIVFHHYSSAVQPSSIQYLWECFLTIPPSDFDDAEDTQALPNLTEPEIVRIHLDSNADVLDFSGLDKHELEFAKDFIGAFRPHPDFTTSDLLIDDGC